MASRTAEAYFHQVLHQADPLFFPVVAVMGANHMQPATGAAPLYVRQRDLQVHTREGGGGRGGAATYRAYV